MGRPVDVRALALAATLLQTAACGDGDATPDAAPPEADAASGIPGEIPPYEQRDGDAEAGWQALIENGCVGCGVPLEAYQTVFGPAPVDARLPERGGLNATMPYNYTAFTATSGVDVVAPNCLQCHAERLNGELVIGLGN